MTNPFADLIPEKNRGTDGVATTFGYNDAQDNGVGAWGDKTNNPDIMGVSLSRRALRDHFGDENDAHGAMVEVLNPETGKRIIAPIVDKGPAEWVERRQGPTIDLTHAANQAIGGTGRTPVNFRILGHDPFSDLIPEQGAPAATPPGEMGGGDEDTAANPFADLIPKGGDLPTATPRIADDLGLKAWRDPQGGEEVRKAELVKLPERADRNQEGGQPAWLDAAKAFGGGIADGALSVPQGVYTQAAETIDKVPKQWALSAEDQQKRQTLYDSRSKYQRDIEFAAEGGVADPDAERELDRINSEIAAIETKANQSFEQSAPAGVRDAWREMSDKLGGIRKEYAQFYNVDEDFQKSYGGQLIAAAGQFVPQVLAGSLGGLGMVALQSQAFQNAWDDAKATAERNGEQFDPDKAYAYAFADSLQQAILEKAGAESALAGWVSGPGAMTLKKGLQKFVTGFVGEGATEGVQGAVSDVLASTMGIEKRNPLDLERRAMDVSIGGILGGSVAGVGAGAQAVAENRQAAKEKPKTFTNLADIPDIAATQEAETVIPVTEPASEKAPTTQPLAPIVQDSATYENLDDDAEFQRLVELARADLMSTERDENADLLDDETQFFEEEEPRDVREISGIESALTPEKPIEETKLSARMAVSLAEKSERGAVDLSAVSDVLDYGRTIYRKGMDFLEWSMQMVKDLGAGIQSSLRKIWDAVTGGNMLPHARNRGSVVNPFVTQAEATLAPMKKGPDLRLEMYAKAKDRLAKVSEQANNIRQGIENIGTVDNSATTETRLLGVEQKLNETLANLDQQEAEAVAAIGDENLASFMDRIEAAKTPEARSALKRDASAMARAKTQGARKLYQEKRKAAEARANMDRAAVVSSANARAGTKDAVAESRAGIIGGLAQLEAITSALPAPVRGKIGGVVKMASLKTDEARKKYLADRVELISKELETALRGEYVDRIERLLDKAQPKRAENRTVRSKIGPQAQSDVAYISKVAELDADKLADEIGALEKKASSSSNPKLLAETMNQWALAERFGNLVDRSPEELAGAWKTLSDIVRGGRESWKVQEEARIEENKNKVQIALAELGRPFGSMENELRGVKDLDNSMLRRVRDLVESPLAWFQTLQETFGTRSKTADHFERTVRLATGKYEDGQINVRDTFRAKMREIFNVKSEAKIHDKLAKMNRPRNTGVEFMEGRTVKSVRIPIDRAQDAIAGKGEAYGFDRKDLIEIQALLDDAAENPRKRVIVYDQETNPGAPVTQTMSELEAIQYLLSWGQSDVRARMERQGITPAAIKGLERFVSPEGHKIKDWLRERYKAEYNRMNEVYRRLFGMDMPQIENYAPTAYDVPAAENQTSGPFGAEGEMSGMTPGFVKSRVNHNEMMRSTNALETYFRHAIQSEYWMAFAEVNREIRPVLGNSKVMQTIRGTYGGRMEERFKNWMKSLEKNGIDKSSGIPELDSFIKKRMGTTALTALGGKVGVLMKQIPAATGFLLEVPPHQAAISISRFITGRLSAGISDAWKSPTMQRRVLLGSSPAVRAVMNQGGVTPGRLLALGEAGMTPMNLTDATFTSFSAAVAFDYHYRNAMRQGFGEVAAQQIAADKMDETVRRTAQPTSLTDRSLMEGTGSGVVKMIMMFKSEARQKFAISYLAAKRAARGEDVGMNIQRFLVAWVLAGLLNQAMGDFYRAIFRGDDEISGEDYARAGLLGNINGLFVVGDVASDAIKLATGGKVWQGSGVSPLGDAIRALSSKKANPANWKDGDDAMEGLRIITTATANLAGSTGMAALAVPQNMLRDAIGLGRRMGIIEEEKKKGR